MSTTKENALVGPCGGSCGHCPFYTVKDDPALMELMVTKLGCNRDKLPCRGCRPTEGKSTYVNCTRETLNDLPAVGSTCATYACSVEHGVEFCYECPEFPCVKLQPCADMADLPHNLKVFWLCCLKRQGLTEFLKNYDESRNLYYSGKMVIGQGPQMTEDGLRAIKELQEQLQQIRERMQQNAEAEKSQE